jgi:hypothetical protein
MIGCFTAHRLVVNTSGRPSMRECPLFRETVECMLTKMLRALVVSFAPDQLCGVAKGACARCGVQDNGKDHKMQHPKPRVPDPVHLPLDLPYEGEEEVWEEKSTSAGAAAAAAAMRLSTSWQTFESKQGMELSILPFWCEMTKQDKTAISSAIHNQNMVAIKRVEYKPGSFVRLFYLAPGVQATLWHDMPFVDVPLE